MTKQYQAEQLDPLHDSLVETEHHKNSVRNTEVWVPKISAEVLEG